MISRDGGRADRAAAVLRVRAGARAHPAPACHARRPSTTTAGTRSSVPFADAEACADEVSGFGPDVVVVQPPEVREAVVRRLEGAAGRRTGGGRMSAADARHGARDGHRSGCRGC